MAADQGPVVQSALLRSELVRLRKERGLTQQQVARELEWSASKLIRVEGGASSITKVDLDALLSKYGVTSESHRERLQSLNRAAKERGWWGQLSGLRLPGLSPLCGPGSWSRVHQTVSDRVYTRPAADSRVRQSRY